MLLANLYAQFTVLYCDNALLLVWLGLGTKTPWLWLGKDDVLASITRLSHHKHSCILSQDLVIITRSSAANSQSIDTVEAGKCLKVSAKKSSGFVLTNLEIPS